MTAVSKPLLISQELFDETLFENEEVFELEADQALKETIDQFSKQQQSLSHLCLLHPDSTEGRDERKQQAEFLECLKRLDESIDKDGEVRVSDEATAIKLTKTLERVRETLSNAEKMHRFITLIHQHEAMYTFMSLMGVIGGDSQPLVTVLDETLLTLIVICQESVELRDLFAGAWDQWTKLFALEFEENCPIRLHLLQLAFVVCKNCESNKVLFIRSKSAVQHLLEGLEIHEKENVLEWTASCRLVTVVCKYDDFRECPKGGPTTSSAHDNVLVLANDGAIPLLIDLLKHCSGDNIALVEACLGALRVLAIQDQVVQTMVALGLLDMAQEALQEQVRVGVVAATLGLLRNLSANDEIKTTLCSNDKTLEMVCTHMKQHLNNTAVQEHGCALFAAMALRKPKNSQMIVLKHSGHLRIVTAMKQFPNHVPIQRQGCLAIRNLASRQLENDAVPQSLLEAGAEQVLRHAGQHQGSVDEAYAALRDLKCAASLVTIDSNGEQHQSGTSVFGQVKTSFRPVYDTSEELRGV